MADTSALLGGTQPRGMMPRGRTDAINTFNVYNNIVVNAIPNILSTSYGDSGVNNYTIKVTMRNNVSYMTASGTGKHVWIGGPTWWTAGTTIDYNAYNTNTGQQWAEDVTGYTFAQWQAKAQLPDSHSSVIDPRLINQSLLVNPGAYNWATDANRWPAQRNINDFRPLMWSLLVNNGQVLSTSYTDIRGYSRTAGTGMDIGPFFGRASAVMPALQEQSGALNTKNSAAPAEINVTYGKSKSRIPKQLRAEPPPMAKPVPKRRAFSKRY
jgi:hypothetical protein